MRPLMCALMLSACGFSEGSSPQISRQAIIGGTPTTDYPAVMLLVAYAPNHSSYVTCSAVLIAPTVLLTAGHCIDPLDHGTDSFGVFVGADASSYTTANSLIAQLVPVKEVHVPPDYDSNPPFTGDIGIVVLQSPLAITPMPVNRAPPDVSILGGAARMVGYGETTYQQYNAKRETAATIVDSLEAQTITIGDAQHLSCIGDSGGPALVNVNGVETVFGTDSYTDETGCLAPAHYRRTDVYAAFIAQYAPAPVVDAGTGGGSEPPDSGTGGSGGGTDAVDSGTGGSAAGGGSEMPVDSGTGGGAAGGGSEMTGDSGTGGGASGTGGGIADDVPAKSGCTTVPQLLPLLGLAALLRRRRA